MMVAYKGKLLDIRLGDIVLYRNEFVLSRPITWLAALIRWATRCRYNHCALVVERNGKLYLNEAMAEGVISRPLEEHLWRYKSSIRILRAGYLQDCPLIQQRLNIQANKKIGTPYDFGSLLLYQGFYRLTGIWLGRRHKDASRAMTCFEYAAWCHWFSDRWWLYTGREFLEDKIFHTVWEEESHVVQTATSAPAA